MLPSLQIRCANCEADQLISTKHSYCSQDLNFPWSFAYENIDFTCVDNALHNFLRGEFLGMMLCYCTITASLIKHVKSLNFQSTLVQENTVFSHMGNLKVRHCTVLNRELVILQSVKCY